MEAGLGPCNFNKIDLYPVDLCTLWWGGGSIAWQGMMVISVLLEIHKTVVLWISGTTKLTH